MIQSLSTRRSTLGRETTIRITRRTAEALNAHMRRNDGTEQMAFGLASPTQTEDGSLFLVNEILLPDVGDLAQQSAGAVCPTQHFQSTVYLLAQRQKKSIVEFHTHPGSCQPRFSAIDERYGIQNAEYIRARLPDPATLVMVVGNNRFDAFDAVVFDRHVGEFFQVHRLEILGRLTQVFSFGQGSPTTATYPAEFFDRQRRIPGWNQKGLELQRVGILGAGGNGAPLLQLLTSIGAAREGFIAIADPDTVEPSNLARIPYATAEHVGIPKVSIAAQYVGRKAPTTAVFPFPCRFHEPSVLRRMKMATVLFYCGDNDGGRKEVNDVAVRFGIPMIDLGCDIQVSEEKVVAGGQIRLVLPGETACLVCCRGFDPAQAALDQMDAAARARQASHGYVIGSDAEATPSVANLNGITAQFAVAQFLALVNGAHFAQWDYLHFDAFTGRTVPAATTWDPECPQCGRSGSLMAGDPAEDAPPSRPTIRRWFAGRAKDSTTAAPPATESKRRKSTKQS